MHDPQPFDWDDLYADLEDPEEVEELELSTPWINIVEWNALLEELQAYPLKGIMLVDVPSKTFTVEIIFTENDGWYRQVVGGCHAESDVLETAIGQCLQRWEAFKAAGAPMPTSTNI